MGRSKITEVPKGVKEISALIMRYLVLRGYGCTGVMENVGKFMGMTSRTAKDKIDNPCDFRFSEYFRLAKALKVPADELAEAVKKGYLGS